MVAISLYKGKLHRSPDVPHQWLMPARKITLKDFKTLLQRRSKALSRLEATIPNPNPNANSAEDADSGDSLPPDSNGPASEDVAKDEGTSKVNDDKPSDDKLAKSNHVVHEVNGQKESKEADEDETLVTPGEQLVAVDEAKAVVDAPENASNAVDDLQQEMNTDAPLQHQSESLQNNTLSDIEKRKKEVEEKLQILNARKHNLVQVLKQILSAEEELRRRSNVQGSTSTGHPSISLQVDVGNDSGSMSRQVTPRPASEVNCNGDTEGADADDGPNHNQHSRSLPRMSSVSPSSDSLHRRTPFAMVSNPSRTTSGVVTSSPSRFAPTSQQGNGNPTVSVTGTNYIASSPSPAANGGTSVFRDARLPSPWN